MLLKESLCTFSFVGLVDRDLKMLMGTYDVEICNPPMSWSFWVIWYGEKLENLYKKKWNDFCLIFLRNNTNKKQT
jgi:hypothetical protein